VRLTFLISLTVVALTQQVHAAPPNILWISTEDISANLGCYGDEHAITPRLDDLAERGWLYENAFTAAPVCAPNRTAIITGMWPCTTGGQHMRSGGEGIKTSIKPELPPGVKMFPEYLGEAGYYCTNNSKQDYNFKTPKTVWDESNGRAHWKNRPDPDQPFFAVFNFTGSHEGSVRADKRSHEKNIEKLTEDQLQDPDDITPPPYHVDTPVVREQWANYYENITALDYYAGALLDELEAGGVADNTIVLFWSDHGAGVPRCKRWPYDSGVHVPVIMYVPDALREQGTYPDAGSRIDDLVSSLDFPPTTLAAAGLEVPGYMAGRDLLNDPAPDYVYSIRDRMDERYEIIRSVRSKDYRYIINYTPWLPYNQYMNTAEKSPIRQAMADALENGTLPETAWWFAAETKPLEELYDVSADPHNVRNIADESRTKTDEFRSVHDAWYAKTKDTGLIPEPALWRLADEHGHQSKVVDAWGAETHATLQGLAKVARRPDASNAEMLLENTVHELSPFRYWGVIGLSLLESSEVIEAALTPLLEDPAGEVRVAAAEELARDYGHAEDAVPVLIEALQRDEEWVRLYAATALDHLDELARPAVEALHEALKDTENKYVVRVVNRALNQLEGTSRDVR